MNIHPIITPASPSLASPIFDASFDSIESLTTTFTASALPTLETTTVTEVALGYHRNQQYSITAMTTSTGAVAERYAYTAYGQPTILNASGTVLTSSAVGNRYTYTGREWDETLGLHHFRARWMSPLAGRFLGRDPIGYAGGLSLFQIMRCSPTTSLDPDGLRDCKITVYGGHNYNVREMLNEDYPDTFPDSLPRGDSPPGEIPDGDYVIGVGCGANIDVINDENPDSFQDYIEEIFPCHSVWCGNDRELNKLDNPINGLQFQYACKRFDDAVTYAKKAAKGLCKGKSANPSKCKQEDTPKCEKVTIEVKCDKAMENLSKGLDPDTGLPPIPDDWWLKGTKHKTPRCQHCGEKFVVNCAK